MFSEFLRISASQWISILDAASCYDQHNVIWQMIERMCTPTQTTGKFDKRVYVRFANNLLYSNKPTVTRTFQVRDIKKNLSKIIHHECLVSILIAILLDAR